MTCQVNFIHGSQFEWFDFLSPLIAQLYKMNQLGLQQMYNSGTGFLESNKCMDNHVGI